jgi:two-component system chemotaxis response regulator CheB
MIGKAYPPPAGPCPLLVIGASTGGTRVLPDLIAPLSQYGATIVIVQHMPRYINASLVRTLGRHAACPVSLVRDGDRLEPAHVYVAPSEVHCTFVNNRGLRLAPGPTVNYVCPSIDVTMQSLRPPDPGQVLIGILLTGMGRDGASGLVHLKQLGGTTFAQNQASCAVYGMPAEAVKLGCVDHLLPPLEIARYVGRKLGGVLARPPAPASGRPPTTALAAG